MPSLQLQVSKPKKKKIKKKENEKKILRFPPIPKLHFCSLGTCKLCNITIWEVVEVKSKMYCNLDLETLYYQALHKTMYATKNPANGIVEIY